MNFINLTDYDRARAKNIIYNMFVNTADENYILARYSQQNGLTYNFFWLSLHSVEKYLKAILLLNGKSSKDYSHDITKLYTDVLAINNRITFSDFDEIKSIFQGLCKEENVSQFIKRLNKYGNPHNRYALNGVRNYFEDIHKVDHIVWHARRYCRYLNEAFAPNVPKLGTNLDFLNKNKKHWKLSSPFLIEKCIRNNEGNLSKALLSENISFNENLEMISNARNSKHISQLETISTWEEKSEPLFQWFIDNVEAPKSIKKHIQTGILSSNSIE